jgi:hypothetical protein
MAVDYNQMWNEYQSGKRKDGIRDFTSMDDVEVFDSQGRSSKDSAFENGVSTNEGSYRSPWAAEAARRGLIANDDASIARASQELARTGRLLYQPGQVRTFDQDQVDSYNIQDPQMRSQQAAASQAGHDLPDSTDLSRAGWQNVSQDMREKFRDQGSIPQAPKDQLMAQTGNTGQTNVAGMLSTAMPAFGSVDNSRRDNLFNILSQRASQGLATDRRSPGIAGQADAFSAAAERARRNYISDMAEQMGPLGNIQGERRMAAERMGQSVGNFEATLIGNEVQAKRNEIAQALAQMGSMLSDEQRMALEQQLAQLDATVKTQLGNRGFDIEEKLGMSGLGNDLLRTLLGNQQFYAGMGSENDRFLADLGLRSSDRARYYDLLERGLIGS